MTVDNFGARLLGLREGAAPPLTRKAMADVLGVTVPQLRYWESGQTNPPIEVLERIAEQFGVSVHWLVTGRGPRSADAVEALAEPADALDALMGQFHGMAPRVPWETWVTAANWRQVWEVGVYRETERIRAILADEDASDREREFARATLEQIRDDSGLDLFDSRVIDRVEKFAALMRETEKKAGVEGRLIKVVGQPRQREGYVEQIVRHYEVLPDKPERPAAGHVKQRGQEGRKKRKRG